MAEDTQAAFMKWRTSIPLLLVLSLIGGIAGHHLTTEVEVPKPATIQERIRLLAGDASFSHGTGAPTEFEKELGRQLTKDEIKAFQHTDKGPWKTFEDEFIRFEIPDDPLIQVQVVEKQVNSPIRVVGGVVSMADNRFERAYWIKVGDSMHYGAILLKEADWLDEGICLCGAIAFKKCIIQDGTLLEFSLLESGEIKKVQALGAKHRAVLFEWTHSVIPQASYARIGGSLRLEEPSPHTAKEWHALSEKKRGWMGRIAWLEKGSSSEEVEEILGEPALKKKNQWVYVRDHWTEFGHGFKITAKLGFQGGQFKELGADYLDGVELPPKHGTVAWANEQLKKSASSDSTEAQKAADRARDMPIMMDLFLTHAPDATTDEWSQLSGMVESMADQGWMDDRLLELVVQRFSEPGFASYDAISILKAYEYKDTQVLVTKCLDAELGKPAEDQAWLSPLISALKPKNPAFVRLVCELSVHPKIHTRSEAYDLATKLPQQDALQVLLKALAENEEYIRQAAAENLVAIARQSDVLTLQQLLEKEKASDVRKHLKTAIETATSRP